MRSFVQSLASHRRGNIAHEEGGAIKILAMASSTLRVEDSLFDSNAVRVQADGGGEQVTVRLNTGEWTNPAAEYMVPIWRIDDGPVYGIPVELCTSALQRSQEAVARGFPPSFPDLTCANVSYTGPYASYSRVVRLAEGAHILWTGLLIFVSHAESHLDVSFFSTW